MQRGDGTFGALIIREPKSELPKQIQNLYDYDLLEHVMTAHDWDHKTGPDNFAAFHHSIEDNKPVNILINGKGRYYTPEKEVEIQTIKPMTLITATTKSSLSGTAHSTANSNDGNEFNETNDVRYSALNKRQTREAVDSADGNIGSKIEVIYPPYEVFRVENGSKYRFRTINAGFLNCPLEISIDNHTLLVIASDGHYFEPVMVDTLVTYAGERFDFVVNADQPIGNYWIRFKGLVDCNEKWEKAHQGAIFRYNGAAEQNPVAELTYDFKREGFQLNSLNRGVGHVDSVSVAELKALDPDTPELLSEFTDYKFWIYYDFYDKDFPHFNNPELYSSQSVNHNNLKFFGPQLNHISMKMPSTPFLIGGEQNDETKYCNSSSLAERNINCRKDFCECTHVLQVPLNSTVEVVLVDEGYKYDANHPFHLHGHDFRVVAMERIQPSGVTVEQVN